MCSHSVSGSSLLSGYDGDNARETSGRTREEFEQIDAVLYHEELPKRASLKRIREEWSNKPHFRIRGRTVHLTRSDDLKRFPFHIKTSTFSSHKKQSIETFNSNTHDLNELLDNMNSGRSSVDSIEGSDVTNNSDFDDDDTDVTRITVGDHFSGTGGGDSFDTDEDDDENGDYSVDITRSNRTKHPRYLIKSVKEAIINSLVLSLLQPFLAEQQPLIQRYAKQLCARNSVVLRQKLRPSSLPPRSLSQNRFSLPGNTSNMSAFQQQLINAQAAYRATPEPTLELKSLLRVTPLRNTNPVPSTAATAIISPRKSQVIFAPQPERTSTSLAIEKRNPQQISLIGTAVVNLPLQLTLSTPQPSQSQTRQTPSSAWRYRSATTITSNSQNPEPITRLPPITIERLSSNDQLVISRPPEPTPPATRIVSGNSTGSNFSSTVKIRTLPNNGKLQRPSRPVTISSNKDLNNSSSTSPARSITTTNIPSTALRTTAITRSQPQQKRTPNAGKTRPPPPPPVSSNTLKVPTTHIRQITKELKISSMDTIVSSRFLDSSSQLLSDS